MSIQTIRVVFVGTFPPASGGIAYSRYEFSPDNPVPNPLPAGYNYFAQVGSLSDPGDPVGFILPDPASLSPGTFIIVADESGTASEARYISIAAEVGDIIGNEWINGTGIYHAFGVYPFVTNGVDKWMQLDTISSDVTMAVLHVINSMSVGASGEVIISGDGSAAFSTGLININANGTFNSGAQLSSFNGPISIDAPNRKLYKTDGTTVLLDYSGVSVVAIFPDADPHIVGAGYWSGGVFTRSAG